MLALQCRRIYIFFSINKSNLHTAILWQKSLSACVLLQTDEQILEIHLRENRQFKIKWFMMINGAVWPSPELCVKCLSTPQEKKKRSARMSLMNVCVAPCRGLCVCVFSRLLYAVVWHSPWQLWTFHSARTVREREGEREGGEVRRGRGKPRQKVGLGWFFGGRGGVYLSVCEWRRRACLYVLAQRGFCPFSHHHLVMCDEGQACLWGETLPEVPHSQPGWYRPGMWIEASPGHLHGFLFPELVTYSVFYTGMTTILISSFFL